MEVLQVQEDPEDEGQVWVTVTVDALQERQRSPQGLEAVGGDVLVRPSRISLLTAGQPYEPESPGEGYQGWLAPEGNPYRAVWTLRFLTPAGEDRSRLELAVSIFGQRLRLPLRGAPQDEEGREGALWTALGDDGRLHLDGLTAVGGSERRVSTVADGPLWLPRGPGAWVVQTPGYPDTPLTVGEDDGWTRFFRLSPATPQAASRGHLARALLGDAPPERPETWVDVGLRHTTPEDLAAWVRQEVEVLSAQGAVRSHDALIRTRIGTPLERASFVHEVLERRGLASRVQCADPKPASARALYVPQDEPELPGQARLSEALLAASRPEQAQAGGERGRVPLVPEWCWVAYAEEADGAWEPLWLEPDGAPSQAALDEVTWRVFNRARGDRWWMRYELKAFYDDPEEGRSEVSLMYRDVTPESLESVALLVDVRREGAGYRVREGAIHPEEPGLREGVWLPRDGLTTLGLRVHSRDPLGVVPDTWEWTLWERDDLPPEAWRFVITGDVRDDQEGRVLAERLDALRPGRHAAPGALALALESWRVMGERGDARGAHEPGVMISWVEVGSSGEVRRFLQPVRPLSVAATGSAEAIARRQSRLSARDALVRARALGVAPPDPPVRWVQDGGDLGQVPGMGRRVQTSLVRAMDFGHLGVSEGGDLWWSDPVSGAWMWIAPAGVSVPWSETEEGREDLIAGEAFWDVPTRCLVQRGWPGVTPDPACASRQEEAGAAPE